MKLKPLIVAMGFATVPLSGCGGGDSDGEISKTKDPIPESAVTSDVYSIKAVDGYLRNAEVWLDINGNSLHDKNEPFAISKDGGVADLDVSGIDNPEQYSVMVKAIAGKTVDEDTVTETNKAGVPITKPFVLSAPAGESIISPLSTLVQINMNNQMTKEEALAKVAQDLNIETSTILSDYVESNLGDVASKANAIVELGIVPESAEELKQDIQELENKLSEHVDTIKQVVAGQLIIKDEDGKAIIVPNADKDDDGIIDAKDAFPEDASEWLDTDSDGIGNNKDTDDDGDGVADVDDVFPLDSTESVDTDGDNIGNNKDTDDDNDGVADVDDALPLDKTESVDTDSDGIGNNKDTDDDDDGIADTDDAFPLDSSESADTDGDKIGNNKDTDDDGDSVADADDAFPLDKTESVDTDSDGIGNNKDTDDDGDGVLDSNDAFPLDQTESVDTDGDTIGNNKDTDDDNDGVLDSNDAFPANKLESVDTDGDGIGNNADLDDDNDGYEDTVDTDPLVELTTPATFGECISSLPKAFEDSVSELKNSALYHVSRTNLNTDEPWHSYLLVTEKDVLNDWQGIAGLDVKRSLVEFYHAGIPSLEVDPLMGVEYEYFGTGDNEGRYFGFQDIENRWYALNLTNGGFSHLAQLSETQTVVSTRITPWAPSVDDPQEIAEDITYVGKEIIEGPDGPQEVCVQSYAYDLTYINKSGDENRNDLNIKGSGFNYIGYGEMLVKTIGSYTDYDMEGNPLWGYKDQVKTLQGYTEGAEVVGQNPVEFKSEMDLLREEYLEYNKDTDGDGAPDRLDEFPDNPFESIDTDKDGIGNNADLDDDNDGYEDIFDSDPLVALVTPDTYGECLLSLPQEPSHSVSELSDSILYEVKRKGLEAEHPSYYYQLTTENGIVNNWQNIEALSVKRSLVELYDPYPSTPFISPLIAQEYEYTGIGSNEGKYYGFQEINNKWYGLNLSTDGFSKLAKLNETQKVESVRITPWSPLKEDPQTISEDITYVGKEIILSINGYQEVCVQSYNYDFTYMNKSEDSSRNNINIKASGVNYIGPGELLVRTVGNYHESDIEGNPIWGYDQEKELQGYIRSNEVYGVDISSFIDEMAYKNKEYQELTKDPVDTGSSVNDFLQENSTFVEYATSYYGYLEKLTFQGDGSAISFKRGELTYQNDLSYFGDRDFEPTYILLPNGKIEVDSNSANIVDNGDGSVTYEQENQLYQDVITGKEVDLSGTNITYFLRNQKLYIPEMWDYKEQFSPGAKALISKLAISEYYYLDSDSCYEDKSIDSIIECNLAVATVQPHILSDLLVSDFSQSGDIVDSYLVSTSTGLGFFVEGLIVQIDDTQNVKLFNEVYNSETGIYTLNEIPLSADSVWQYTNNESMISLNIKLEDENAQYSWVNQYTIENINKTLVTELDGKLVKVKRSPASIEDTVFFNEIASNDIERVMAISDVNDTATACGDSMTSLVDAISASYPSSYTEVIQQCNNLSDEFDLFAANSGKVLKVVSSRGDIHVISADSVATYSQNGVYVAPIGQAVDSVFDYQVTDLGRDGTYNIVVYSQVKSVDSSYSHDVWSAKATLEPMFDNCYIPNGSVGSEEEYHQAVTSCITPNLASSLIFHPFMLNGKTLTLWGNDYNFNSNQTAVNPLTNEEFSWSINDKGALQLDSLVNGDRKIFTLIDVNIRYDIDDNDYVSLEAVTLEINSYGEQSYNMSRTSIEFK
ncbi:thrombospondin type 3 repeat-containing protein [Photobacterium leiognathi]|uniref:thrombospondin type 3 repeat-containing protein n=1 Tax=Photobacterium leiognathi TaxID=553611 RepID=UPI002981CEA2|nr:thrombospondin type 3 repeat-containing protein [Photobacterium leiognathi]